MKTLTRFSLLFCTVLGLTLSAAAQGVLSPDQKALMKAALNVAVGKQPTLPDYADISNKKEIVLFNKMTSLEHPDEKAIYLTEADVPEVKKAKLLLQNETQINDTTRKADLVFVRVTQIAQPESDFGVVTVLGQVALGADSRAKGYLFKQVKGQTMLFKKVNGDWEFQRILTTFPNLLDFKEF